MILMSGLDISQWLSYGYTLATTVLENIYTGSSRLLILYVNYMTPKMKCLLQILQIYFPMKISFFRVLEENVIQEVERDTYHMGAFGILLVKCETIFRFYRYMSDVDKLNWSSEGFYRKNI